ncbi:RDD family protein [bacterium]|nr:RDD family protein [bacterium]
MAEEQATPEKETKPEAPAKETKPKGNGKADLGKRFLAALIDVGCAFVVGLIPIIGGLIGAAYMLLRDGLEFDFMDHRSIGKKVMKLRPVMLDGGGNIDTITSVKRNWMFALGAIVQVLMYIPVIGWALIPVVGVISLILGIIEIVLVLTDPEGRRMGDKLAGTKVVEVDS